MSAKFDVDVQLGNTSPPHTLFAYLIDEIFIGSSTEGPRPPRSNKSTTPVSITPVVNVAPDKSWLPSWKATLMMTRAHSPLPSLLLMWPCFWSSGMASSIGMLPSPILLTKFAIGAYLMRSAGCKFIRFRHQFHLFHHIDHPFFSFHATITIRH